MSPSLALLLPSSIVTLTILDHSGDETATVVGDEVGRALEDRAGDVVAAADVGAGGGLTRDEFRYVATT